MNTEEPTAEAAIASDGSTVGDSPTENDVPNDDAFTYLHGLNSDNLMQFSQQSVLKEIMLKEHLGIKPNLDILPTFDQHDSGGYQFNLNICTPRKGKVNWIYSESLNKVYIRMNEIFNIEASYMPMMPRQQLRIRALLCFAKEVSEPVLRCQNHMSIDTETNPDIRCSLMRCENPTAEYRGRMQGKSISDRLSIILPLNCSAKHHDDGVVEKQMIALKFTCQNSCIGRKETSIIFLLESLNGEIFSQRVIDVKISCCPKRDKSKDERDMKAVKRKMNDDLYPRKKRILREASKLPIAMIKEERTDTVCDLQATASGGYRIVIEVPTKEIASRVIECGFNRLTADVYRSPYLSDEYLPYINKLRTLHEESLKRDDFVTK